jgi:RNA polymerase sigma factor (sigma-70 family)
MAHRENTGIASVVRAAAEGDENAWRALVAQLTPALRGAAFGFRLAAADVDDVVQETWLRAYRHLGRLKNPEAILAWLLVTTRREALRRLQRRVPEIPTDTPPDDGLVEPMCGETVVLASERMAALRAAVSRLPDRQRALLGAMISKPGCTYEDLSSALEMPMGSIGPTRDRGLERLRRDEALRRVVAS